MTTGETIDLVNDALTSLRLKDRYGDMVEGILALNYVTRIVGDDWEDLDTQWEMGMLANEAYLTEALALIDQCRGVRYRAKVEHTLANLRYTMGVA